MLKTAPACIFHHIWYGQTWILIVAGRRRSSPVVAGRRRSPPVAAGRRRSPPVAAGRELSPKQRAAPHRVTPRRTWTVRQYATNAAGNKSKKYKNVHKYKNIKFDKTFTNTIYF